MDSPCAAHNDIVISFNHEIPSLRVLMTLHDLDKNESVCLPAFGQRHHEFFKTISVTASPNLLGSFDSTSLPFDDKGCFSLLPDGVRDLSFSYEFIIHPLDQHRVWIAQSLSPNMTQNYVAFPGEALFVERSKTYVCSNIRVALSPNSANTYSQFFSTLDSNQNIFFAQHSFMLNRSYFVLGNNDVFSTTDNNLRVSVITESGLAPFGNTILNETLDILKKYRDWMPDVSPQHVTVFVFAAPHDVNAAIGFARPDGVVLQLGKNAILQQHERRFLLAHELFHLYNGESLHFVSADYLDTAWFREGMTDYMALKALVEINLVSDAQYQKILNKILTNTINHHEYHINPQSSHYSRGFFLSWLIEQNWEKLSPPLSLAGFWSYLAQVETWSDPKTSLWIQNHLESYSQMDFSAFFSTFVFDNAPVPFLEIINRAGFCTQQGSKISYSAGFSSHYDPTFSLFRITNVVPNDVAAQAGLKIGDAYVPNENTNWNSANDKIIYKFDGKNTVMIRMPVHPVMTDNYFVVPCP